MDLHQIRYFLAVCETLNFTKAAERCHITQPSLTRAIQNLERELNGDLFIRGRAGTILTPLGEAMRQQLGQVQRHVNSARATAEGWTKGTRGTLRIGVSGSAGPKGIARFLGTFLACHEGVALTVIEGNADDLISWLDCTDIDAALVAYPHVLPPKPEVRYLYEERLVVLVPVRHSLAKLDHVPLAELAGERILMNIHGDLRNSILSVFKAATINVNITCHSSRDEWLIGMVAEGAGIAIVPDGFSLPPSLTTRPLTKPTQQQSIHLLLGPPISHDAMVSELREFADQYLVTRLKPVVTPIAV